MYDAEVAYQDHLLAQLLETLNDNEHREHTLVVLASDHGEMLGEHGLMGHGFGVFQELIHVPLLIRHPSQAAPSWVSRVTSTCRLFHTMLHAAGREEYRTPDGRTVRLEPHSLIPGAGPNTEPNLAYSEAYAPAFALNIMKRHYPRLIERLHCQTTNWAVVSDTHKLIRCADRADRLFALQDDPREERPLEDGNHAHTSRRLGAQLDAFVRSARERRLDQNSERKADLDDESIRQRLRGLGYID
jgi:arylsulfatase A-like enzyme